LLEENAGRFARTIDRAGEDIRQLFDLYRDIEAFKQLLARQETVQRRARFPAEKRDLDFEAQALMKELGEEQAKIRDAMAALKTALREHAGPVREAYPKVAGDAEAIAARMDELGIEPLMESAAAACRALDAPRGQAAAQEAYEAMLSMVAFCQGGQGDAQTECERRLRILMGMELGRTFAQLAKNSSFGMNGGTGGVGLGSDGEGGSLQSPFGLYGGSDVADDPLGESPALGQGGKGHGRPAPSTFRVAPEVESRAPGEKSEIKLDLPGGEHLLEEYRSLIIEYFTRMAEGK
jgi:hypothetical protein